MHLLPLLVLATAPRPADTADVLDAPYRTPAQFANAWKPVVSRIEWSLRHARTADPVAAVGPVFRAGSRAVVAETIVSISARRPSCVVTINLTDSSRKHRSRSMKALFFWLGQQVHHQFLGPREIGFGNDRMFLTEGAIVRHTAVLVGQTWGSSSTPSRPVATLLRWTGSSWRVTGRRRRSDPGECRLEGTNPPEIVATFNRPPGPAIRIADTSPGAEYEERWTPTRRGGLRAHGLRVVRNRFWAIEGLVEALRRGSDIDALRFCTSKARIAEAKRAGLASPHVTWVAHSVASGSPRSIELETTIERVSVSLSLHFAQFGEETRISSIRSIALPPR